MLEECWIMPASSVATAGQAHPPCGGWLTIADYRRDFFFKKVLITLEPASTWRRPTPLPSPLPVGGMG